MTDYDLFGDPFPNADADPQTPEPGVSAGRRQTEALRKLAESGLNPLVGTRGPVGRTCGECVHREVLAYRNHSYPKCNLGPRTHGSKTDVRRTWPACHRFEVTP